MVPPPTVWLQRPPPATIRRRGATIPINSVEETDSAAAVPAAQVQVVEAVRVALATSAAGKVISLHRAPLPRRLSPAVAAAAAVVVEAAALEAAVRPLRRAAPVPAAAAVAADVAVDVVEPEEEAARLAQGKTYASGAINQDIGARSVQTHPEQECSPVFEHTSFLTHLTSRRLSH